MITQQTWSKGGSLQGPLAMRQKAMRRDMNVISYLSCTIVEIEEQSGLFTKIITNSENANDLIKDHWFPFKIHLDTFISGYGTLESFKAQMHELRFRLNYFYPYYDEGFVTEDHKIDSIGDKNQSFNLSLGGLINGLNVSDDAVRKKIIKAINGKQNTGIVLESNSIKMNIDGQKFMEVNSGGVSMGGNMNMQSSPTNFKFGGFVSMQNFFTGLIPSTYTSPIPSFQISLPIEQLSSLKDLAAIASGLIK